MKTDSQRLDKALEGLDPDRDSIDQLRNLGWTITPPPEPLGKAGDVRWCDGNAWMHYGTNHKPWSAASIQKCRFDAQMAGSVPMLPVPDGHVVVPEDRVLPEGHVPIDLRRHDIETVQRNAAVQSWPGDAWRAELARRETKETK